MDPEQTRPQPSRHRRRPNRAAESPGEAAAGLPALEPCPAPESVSESHPSWMAQGESFTDDVQVILRVAEAGYVPAGVQVRARISALLFTGQLAVADLERVQQDPRVVSVGFPRSVHPAGDR